MNDVVEEQLIRFIQSLPLEVKKEISVQLLNDIAYANEIYDNYNLWDACVKARNQIEASIVKTERTA